MRGHRELTFPITTGYVYYTAKKTTYGESHEDYIHAGLPTYLPVKERLQRGDYG